MSFHFCSHSWEVRDLQDGTLVKLTNRDLDNETVPILDDELFVLVAESGRPNLYLDFANIRLIAGAVLSKLAALNTKLSEHGGRLVLRNVNPLNDDAIAATRLTEILDIRTEEAAETLS